MLRKILASMSIATLAIFGIGTATQQLDNLSKTQLKPEITNAASSREVAPGIEDAFVYNGLFLKSVGQKSFTFSAYVTATNEDWDTAQQEINDLITAIENEDSTYLQYFSYTYKINDVTRTTSWTETPDLDGAYIEVSLPTSSKAGRNVLPSTNIEVTVHDPDLTQDSKVSRLSLDSNAVFTADPVGGSNGFEVRLDIVDETGVPILLEGFTGEISESGFFIMPPTMYVDDSLVLNDVTTNEIDFSFVLNGTYDETKHILPVITFEDPDNSNRQRLMSAELTNHNEYLNESSKKVTEYSYKINGIANPLNLSTTALTANHEYANVRVYINLTEDDIDGAFVNETIDPSRALNPSGDTVRTTALNPKFNSIEINEVDQTTADFSVKFDASEVIKADDTSLTTTGESEYGIIDEDNLVVQIAPEVSAEIEKAESTGAIDLDVVSWDLGTDDLISANFVATGLTPDSNYKIFMDIDNTSGSGVVSIGTFTTEDYNPYDFTDISVTNESYRDAQITLTMNSAVDAIYDLDNFKSNNIKAYRDVESYDGNDTTIFTTDKLLDIKLDTDASIGNTYVYDVSNLNTENNKDGSTVDGIRFVYSDFGIIDPLSVSDSISITTTPLEYVDFSTIDGSTVDVTQIGQTTSTINIYLPGLNSAGYVSDDALHAIGEYQEVEYGPTGNLQFALVPFSVSEGRAVTDPTEDQILTTDEVIVNGSNNFVLDLSSFASIADAKASGTTFTFDLFVATTDATGTWTWFATDEQVNTTPLFAPEVSNLVVDKTSITQNEVTLTIDVTHNGGNEDSLYSSFDPTTDIEFKGKSLANSAGEQLEIVGSPETLNEVVSGNETISTYKFTLDGLRAETVYTSISTSIQGGEYVDDADNQFVTQNKSMAKIHLTDEMGENAVTFMSSTYDSVTFQVDATTGGNYKTLEGADADDLEIIIQTAFNGKITVDDWKIAMMKESEADAYERALGRYNHVDFETTNTYEITLNGLANPYDYSTIIDAIIIRDNSDVFVSEESPSTYSTNPYVPLTWITTPRQGVQFAQGSLFQILTTSDDEISSSGFEFTFELNYGGPYFDFDPSQGYSSENPWEIRLFAREQDSFGNPRPYYTEVDINYIDTLSDRGDYTHTLRYEATGLKSDMEYSDITLTVDKHPSDIIDGDPFHKKLVYDGTFTTSQLRAPILAQSFYAPESNVTNEGFKFTISVVEGSENEAIKNEGYDVFDSSKAYLGYKNAALQDVAMKTEFLSKMNSTKIIGGREIGYADYEFEVSNLNPDTTYSGLFFNYNGNNNAKVSIPNKSVTTKQYKSPFDPISHPVEFDYESITDDSFEFSILINNTTSKGEYAGFSPEETIMYANYRSLKTKLVNYESNIRAGDDETGQEFDRYTYQVYDLNASTTYENFSVVVNAFGGSKAPDGGISTVYYTTSYDIPYATIRTSRDLQQLYKMFGFVSTLLLIIILILLIYYLVLWYRRYIALGLFGDPNSFAMGTPTFRVVNGNKHKAFKNANLDEMRLYASGEEIQAAFVKRLDSHGEPTGDYQIITQDVIGDSQAIIRLMSAIKYDTFDISFDGGETIEPIHSVADKKVRKIVVAFGDDDKYKKALKKYAKNKNYKSEIELSKAGAGATAIVLFNRSKITSTSIRYEAIIPDGHPILDNRDHMIKTFQMYYQVDDQLYPFDMKYVGNEGAVYSWDLENLEPSTAYVNTHFSFDGGKTIIASLTSYGVTRNEKGRTVKLEDSELATAPMKTKGKGKGTPEKGYPLPELKATVEYLGHSLAERLLVVSTQKHVQRDSGKWIPAKKIKEQFNEYVTEWYKDASALSDEYELHSFIVNWEDEENSKKLSDMMKTSKKKA